MLADGWQLDNSSSSLKFQSIKKGTTIETSSFANFEGSLDPQGAATIVIELNSVDTKVDLRNVRMRFLFFETYKYPTATVTARVTEEVMQVLQKKRRLQMPIEFELDLHGVKKTLTVETVLTMFAIDQISIASLSPVNIAVDQFNLSEGIQKLQEAADVTIVPSGAVSFDLTFKRNESTETKQPEIQTTTDTITPASTALETKGDFSLEECAGRFDILSQTGAINFAYGGSDLDNNSNAVLVTLVDIIQRCPELNVVIAGHTDSSGSDEVNMQLSKERANSVTEYLRDNGIPGRRLRSIGHGESQPLFPNTTKRNRARNRRIEFSID